MTSMPLLVLASSSPRRAELLTQVGLPYHLFPVPVDETRRPAEAAPDYVRRLAGEKAQAAWEALKNPAVSMPQGPKLVLGADTVVVVDGELLGKPTSLDHARAMLLQLSGRAHQVLTAVAVKHQAGLVVQLVTSEVTFRPLGLDEIRAWLATGEAMDKAGAYGIQGKAGIFVASIKGSYSAVVGLPLEETAQLLAQCGAPVWRYWREDL